VDDLKLIENNEEELWDEIKLQKHLAVTSKWSPD
jgi:hypothetical protein